MNSPRLARRSTSKLPPSTRLKPNGRRRRKRGTIDWTPLRPATATAKSGATLKSSTTIRSWPAESSRARNLHVRRRSDGRGHRNPARSHARSEFAGARAGPSEQRQFRAFRIHCSAAPKAAPTSRQNRTATCVGRFLAVRLRYCAAIDGKPAPAGPFCPKPASRTSPSSKPNRRSREKEAKLTITLDFNYGSAHSIGRLRLSTTTHKPPLGAHAGLPAEIAKILDIEPRSARRSSGNAFGPFPLDRAGIAIRASESRRTGSQESRTRSDIPKTLVTTAVEPRTVRILARGNWHDDSGEIVSPAVPTFLLPLEIKDRRPNRLDLARWLVDRKNPLVARVFVNRMWMLMFGQGIVKTTEDFGSQGAAPSHPELLDWLATEFVASGWDVKHLLKLIVMSATYRQSSVATRAAAATRSRQSLARPARPLPARRRIDPRQCLGRQRTAVAENRRAERQAVSAGRLLGLSEFPDARMEERSRRESISPRAVYVVAADVLAAEPESVRRADARGMHRRPHAIEHAAAIAGAVERSDVCRGGARVRRARS